MYSSSENTTCIQIFSKAPVEGYCKTRLIPYLGKKETVQLHMDMVQKTITTAKKINNADVQLWCKPSKQHVFFQKMAKQNALTLHDQDGESLGFIMNNAAYYAADKYTNIIQIGTDCPYIDTDYINSSIAKLSDETKVVIGPANDGGYVLLAKNQYYTEMYDDINWGTSNVLQQLEANLQNLNIKYSKLESLNDIDTFDDFQKWEKGCYAIPASVKS